MEDETIDIGVLRLDGVPEIMKGAWYQRNVRDFVDGTVTAYRITGPDELDAEVHYIQLEDGDKWVVMGESYTGPKWIWKQTKDRLRMSVMDKNGKYAFDLPLPTPSKRDKEKYTMSCANLDELQQILPDYDSLLKEYGVSAIGQRMELFDDTSTRKKHLSAVIEDTDSLAPIIGFCLTRLLALLGTFEQLKELGGIDFTHMVTDSPSTRNNADIVSEIIAEGETTYVEFKPAIWYDYGRARNDPNYKLKREAHVSDNIVRTVAGFLNSEGGTLFVGVSDDGDSYGLEGDLSLTGRKDWDGLENELNQLISQSVSNEVCAAKVKISFPLFQNKKIAKIDIMKAVAPVFMKTESHQNKFYVRIGNATNTMSVESAVNYISQHEWDA
jgi:hypothetical protein